MQIDHRQYAAMMKVADLLLKKKKVSTEQIWAMLIPSETIWSPVQKEIWKWVFKHGLTTDFAMYSQETWNARKEEFGNDAVFSITAESAALRVFDGFCHPKVYQEFDTIVEKHGLFYEWGYTWSLHFYVRT